MIKKKKINKYVVILILLICFGWWLNPAMRIRTEGDIRQSLINKTPLGSQTNQAINDIRGKWTSKDIMLLPQPGYARGPHGYTVAVGKKSIGPVEIGWYWTTVPGLPMITYVFATWVFDENDRLIEVLVHKEIDAP